MGSDRPFMAVYNVIYAETVATASAKTTTPNHFIRFQACSKHQTGTTSKYNKIKDILHVKQLLGHRKIDTP